MIIMSDKWVQTLKNYEKQAIDKVRSVCTDEQVRDSAIKEIKVNCVTIRNFLTRMYRKSYRVNDDLSRVNEDYVAFEDYRRSMNHVEHHLREVRCIPTAVERGEYEAKFSRYY